MDRVNKRNQILGVRALSDFIVNLMGYVNDLVITAVRYCATS